MAARPPHSMSPAELKRLRGLEDAGTPFLAWRDADGAWSFHQLDGADRGPLAIGRSPGADIVLDDARVSSVHAELRLAGDQWLVEDQGLSTNGTFVNGERVGQRRLRDQDALAMGDTLVVFHLPQGAGRVRTTVKKVSVQRSDLRGSEWPVLKALCRTRVLERSGDIPSTPELVRRLHLSDDAINRALTTLFRRFGVDDHPQGRKRQHLIDAAVQSGVVSADSYRE